MGFTFFPMKSASDESMNLLNLFISTNVLLEFYLFANFGTVDMYSGVNETEGGPGVR